MPRNKGRTARFRRLTKERLAKEKNKMIKIEKGIPIPVRGADKKGELRLTLEKMDVGDSIVVPNYLRNVMWHAARAIGIKTTSKTINPVTREMRVWRKE
tara:strand:+ start:511 stop:807 length:297 start_codon:yes stop_codon:yes gene_type:complete